VIEPTEWDDVRTRLEVLCASGRASRAESAVTSPVARPTNIASVLLPPFDHSREDDRIPFEDYTPDEEQVALAVWVALVWEAGRLSTRGRPSMPLCVVAGECLFLYKILEGSINASRAMLSPLRIDLFDARRGDLAAVDRLVDRIRWAPRHPCSDELLRRAAELHKWREIAPPPTGIDQAATESAAEAVKRQALRSGLYIALGSRTQPRRIRLQKRWVTDRDGKIAVSPPTGLYYRWFWDWLKNASIAEAEADLLAGSHPLRQFDVFVAGGDQIGTQDELERAQATLPSSGGLEVVELGEEVRQTLSLLGSSGRTEEFMHLVASESFSPAAAAALTLLAPKERQAVLLVCDYPKAEVARLMGISPSALNVFVSQARRKIGRRWA
jgi:hypothetical protein